MTTSLLNDHVALVTGSSRSLGAAIARALARHGSSVAINYRADEQAAQAVLEDVLALGVDGVTIGADATDPASIIDMVDRVESRLGDITALVLCTSGDTAGLFERVQSGVTALDSIDEIQARVKAGLDAALYASKAVLPGMIRRGGGTIVFIGSAVTHRSSGPWAAEVMIAKAAQDALARVLAAELGPSGIRVNVVAPGFLGTDSTTSESREQIMRSLAAKAPLRRLPSLDDVSNAVVALVSDLNRSVTGAFLAVDSGVTMP